MCYLHNIENISTTNHQLTANQIKIKQTCHICLTLQIENNSKCLNIKQVFIAAPPDILHTTWSARNLHQRPEYSNVFKIGRMFFKFLAVMETETERLIFGLGVSGVLVFARQGLLLKRKRTTDPKCRKHASGLA